LSALDAISDPDREDALVVTRRDVIDVHIVRQRELAPERPLMDLAHQHSLTILGVGVSLLAAAADRQVVVFDMNLDVFIWIDARQFQPEDDVLAVDIHVNRWDIAKSGAAGGRTAPGSAHELVKILIKSGQYCERVS